MGDSIFKNFLIFFILIFIPLSVFTYYDNEVKLDENGSWSFVEQEKKYYGMYDDIYFGSTRDFIEQNNKELLLKKDVDYLLFREKFNEYSLDSFYFFYDDLFYKTISDFLVVHYSAKYWISDYEKIKSKLIEIYGNPDEDEIYYSNSFWIGKLENAFDNNQATLKTVWKKDYKDIVLELFKIGNDTKIIVSTVSNEINPDL
ncbi:MAG: hypothetical protein PWP28_182 [Oceanotoga sp.]|nr:hypothetical protein [Oceanotoga sp.]